MCCGSFREGLQSLINLLQDGLGVLRKCGQLTGLTKMLDHGNMKTRLEELTSFVQQDVAKVRASPAASATLMPSSEQKEETLQHEHELSDAAQPDA